MYANTADIIESGYANAYSLPVTIGHSQSVSDDIGISDIVTNAKNVCQQHGKMLWEYLGFVEKEKPNVLFNSATYMRDHGERMDAMERGYRFISMRN